MICLQYFSIRENGKLEGLDGILEIASKANLDLKVLIIVIWGNPYITSGLN